jgi:predicted RNase H-like HicB family nuclease
MKRSNTSSRLSKNTKPKPTVKREPRDLSKAFDEKLLQRGRELASQYSILFRPSEQHGFSATCLEFPTVFVHGKTVAQCDKKAREALAIGVAVMLEQGDTPPLPASDERRDQQVNIRLTSEEKLLLEDSARRRGYRGLSDFMRAAAMSQTRRSA